MKRYRNGEIWDFELEMPVSQMGLRLFWAWMVAPLQPSVSVCPSFPLSDRPLPDPVPFLPVLWLAVLITTVSEVKKKGKEGQSIDGKHAGRLLLEEEVPIRLSRSLKFLDSHIRMTIDLLSSVNGQGESLSGSLGLPALWCYKLNLLGALGVTLGSTAF
ncbi:hypothetical protein CK203_041680 [Vitis vinifera]|uniref:Uncharacterized protein n=1 Tax=Vitis vinifera TaxID=29760 RepID=A0A438HCT7_VITVI|nr:hypothetical protein CK203_041680 [Vitis vinifera]